MIWLTEGKRRIVQSDYCHNSYQKRARFVTRTLCGPRIVRSRTPGEGVRSGEQGGDGHGEAIGGPVGDADGLADDGGSGVRAGDAAVRRGGRLGDGRDLRRPPAGRRGFGTHSIEDEATGTLYALRSAGADLDSHVGQRATVYGALTPGEEGTGQT